MHKPELTKERFAPNPYKTGEMNARLYRTGELVRWLPDGNLEFLGRTDNQIKVRGLRIETDEIAQQLEKHEAVKQAVVMAREDSDKNKYLCGYFSASRKVTEIELKQFISRELPEFMIPAFLIAMAELPVSANGENR